MIQIEKSLDTASLHTRGYNQQYVQGQLIKDQHSKCYICEREVVTDYQIDHLHSQANYPDEVEEWTNLLLACSYCNQKKSDKYDSMIDPVHYPIEDWIKQTIDYERGKAEFEATDHAIPFSLESTIKLLSSVFNGTTPARKVREEQFYDYFRYNMTLFTKACNQYLEERSEENKQIVSDFLKIEAEFLGFKYWIIQSNNLLAETFIDECRWNRKSKE